MSQGERWPVRTACKAANGRWGGEGGVVVIGAGSTGLTAARKLVAAGRPVTVLHSRDRMGRPARPRPRQRPSHPDRRAVHRPTRDRVPMQAEEVGVATCQFAVPGRRVHVRGRKARRFAESTSRRRHR
ncbi:NAD-binding protein [Streptomyces sp. NPDC007896]|uniref:NAD-binding protein n=1 Tax=Streptomyces sp. NPDC007896 TaxID=3364784 RepID=UPI0036ED3573